MHVRHRVISILIPGLLVAAGIAIASSDGPPTARTGVPAIGGKSAENTCIGCHKDFPLNNGATLTLVNAPNAYIAGMTYTFAVQIASTQTAGNANRVWSFELTAVNMADGNGAGTFTNVAAQGTQIRTGSGQYSTRTYIQSNADRPSASSPVQWEVQWTAPDPGVGSVGFFAAGLAGNGTGSTAGDWVCAATATTQDITPVESVTWGRIKAIYR
jgi:hypothetical protein